jgi:hypothetical protein
MREPIRQIVERGAGFRQFFEEILVAGEEGHKPLLQSEATLGGLLQCCPEFPLRVIKDADGYTSCSSSASLGLLV